MTVEELVVKKRNLASAALSGDESALEGIKSIDEQIANIRLASELQSLADEQKRIDEQEAARKAEAHRIKVAKIAFGNTIRAVRAAFEKYENDLNTIVEGGLSIKELFKKLETLASELNLNPARYRATQVINRTNHRLSEVWGPANFSRVDPKLRTPLTEWAEPPLKEVKSEQ